jgi:hypothetical protein
MGQVMTGVAWSTRSWTEAVAVVYPAGSAGVKVTESVWGPLGSSVPEAGA